MTEQERAGRDSAYEGWEPAADLRTDVPHPARMYDYYLGGKDNFPADRAAAGKIMEVFPQAVDAARANRRFLGRAVRLAADRGVRQFLDIGTGIPAAGNTHEVAQAVAPDSRVVYVDNDPIVLAHARALLRGTPQGRTSYLHADLRDPAGVLGSPQVAETLDLTRPVALLLVAILHFVPDSDDPHAVVRRLTAALPAGSMLVVSHGTEDFATPEQTALKEEFQRQYAATDSGVVFRPHERVVRFFDGWELLEPGLVSAHEWRPEDPADAALDRSRTGWYGGVAVKR